MDRSISSNIDKYKQGLFIPKINNIFRFDLPRVLIIDNETQFNNRNMREKC